MSKKEGHGNDSVTVVEPVEKSEVALREEAILAFWQEHNIFKKSLETPAGSEPVGDFVFYDGPPFATGLPHYGHILAGTMKDAIPRFWTMNGYRVRRQWGWDCHGLPLENIIEKELGLATKKDIEAYGVKNFNEKARSAVLRYADDWRRIVPRMGRFVDMEHDYRTMDPSYTESVWWSFKTLHDKGLVSEGFKSMHLCPRCGTTLSNFEVNQGYKDIKDIAVTVKLPLLDDAGEVTDTSLLVWTTTPWTLPGNLAAAIHKDITYVKVRISELIVGDNVEEGKTEVTVYKDIKSEWVILAKERLSQINFDANIHEIEEEFKGADLVGKKYQPPFAYLQDQDMEGKDNAWTIYHAEYVELGEEGTGAVHLAPAYGEEDMLLAKEHRVPIFHHVDEGGHFKDFVTDFAGLLVKPKDDDKAEVSHLDTDIAIVRALKASGKLFKKENITHSYPHCWRCDTPLLNYATTSWFVNVPQLKDQLLAENERVHWVPGHVGKNRFGKWLEGARDWAVSRQRYWGAPLPIWKNPQTGDYKVFGSLRELQAYVPKSGNQYYVMRHGESTKNVEPQIVTDAPDAPHQLTEAGRAQVTAEAKKLVGQIDLVFTSPVRRTKETAELMVAELGLPAEALIVDERIREIGHGVYEGKLMADFHQAFPNSEQRFYEAPEGGETWLAVKRRMATFLYDLEQQYAGKNILIVSHGDPLALLDTVVSGCSKKNTAESWEANYPQKGMARKLDFVPMPHNDDFELDFHRPYIDEIELVEGGVTLERIPDVFDCWYESGSMPYAQYHYPFVEEERFMSERYPAQFIAEGLDQTRGWFYSLLVLGTALFGKSPFENVIVNGLVLAEDGKKMSKSLQNYPDPMELADRTGVDAMRFYLLSSPVIRGEDLNFSEKEVLELQRKNIGRLHNVLAMYELCADGTGAETESKHILDRWILSRLNQLIAETTTGYRQYELDRATRPITDFIDDLSVWYLRRSRDRLKGEGVEERKQTLATLRYTLRTLALVLAPVMPFYAEYLWRQVKEDSDEESVHLSRWPETNDVDLEVLEKMSTVRELVTLALDARTKANIKVRQPLATLSLDTDLESEYKAIIADEVNVKEVVYTAGQATRVVLDTTLTPALVAEGAVRDLMRAVQSARKEAGLQPADRITLTIATDQIGEVAVTKHQMLLEQTVGAESVQFEEVLEGTALTIGDYHFTFTIKKN